MKDYLSIKIKELVEFDIDMKLLYFTNTHEKHLRNVFFSLFHSDFSSCFVSVFLILCSCTTLMRSEKNVSSLYEHTYYSFIKILYFYIYNWLKFSSSFTSSEIILLGG